MLLTIIKKELLNNILTARVLICYAAIFVLIFTSVLIRGFQFKTEYAFYKDQTQNELEFQQKREREEKNDMYMWSFGMQLEPRPLSIFCEGYNKHIGMPFRIDTGGGETHDDFDYEDPLMRVFRVYNTAFIVAMIISLLCIFISFDSFAAEREEGTLKLVLSHHISRSTYILGKFIGSYLAVVWPVVFSLLFSLLFLILGMGIRFSGPDLVRFVLLTGAMIFYLSIWFLLSMVCSIVARRSSAALTIAVLAWIALAFVIPYGAREAGKRRVDTLSLSKFYKERALVKRQETDKRNRKWGIVRRSNPPDPGLQEWKIWYDYFFNLFIRMTQTEKLQRQAIKQQMFYGMEWSRLSPAALYLNITSNVAGTGIHDYWLTEEWKVDLFMAYKGSLERELNRRRTAYPGYQLPGSTLKPDFGKFDKSKLPSRVPPVITVAGALGNSLTDMLLLLLGNIVLFVTGFYVFIRQEDV